MTMSDGLASGFEKHVFYHGTDLEAVESIARHGFSVWLKDEDGERYPSGGALGNGVYVTCDWRVALAFGVVLLRVGMRPGTKILNAAVPPDKKTLDYLQREFGREILKVSAWKCVPANKKLKKNEVICLLRYHFHGTWIKNYGPTNRDVFREWPKRRTSHFNRLADFRSVLLRYGFQGYGNPQTFTGIVVLDGSYVELLELVAYLPPREYIRLDERGIDKLEDLAPVRAAYARSAPQHVKDLGRQITENAAARRKA